MKFYKALKKLDQAKNKDTAYIINKRWSGESQVRIITDDEHGVHLSLINDFGIYPWEPTQRDMLLDDTWEFGEGLPTDEYFATIFRKMDSKKFTSPFCAYKCDPPEKMIVGRLQHVDVNKIQRIFYEGIGNEFYMTGVKANDDITFILEILKGDDGRYHWMISYEYEGKRINFIASDDVSLEEAKRHLDQEFNSMYFLNYFNHTFWVNQQCKSKSEEGKTKSKKH